MSDTCLAIHPVTSQEALEQAVMAPSITKAARGIDETSVVRKSIQQQPQRVGKKRCFESNDWVPAGAAPSATTKEDPPLPEISRARSSRNLGTLPMHSDTNIPANVEVPDKDHNDALDPVAKSSHEPKARSQSTLPQHELIVPPDPLDIFYRSTQQSQKLKSLLVSRLTAVAPSGRIQVVDISRRGLNENDGAIIAGVLRHNPQLAVLRLGDNDLGDKGATLIASACAGRHHQSLTVLDLGFNGIGDDGIAELSLRMIAGNHVLKNLYLAGNAFSHNGAMAIASAMLHGCNLHILQLSANTLGATATKVLLRAVTEMDVKRTHLLHRSGGIVMPTVQPAAVEELHLAGIDMQAEALLSVSSMLLTNSSLQLLNLSNNNIGDKAVAIMSKAFAQNKQVPLASIQLSFNRITCVGVEYLMNALWGSKTLKEVKLDNNKMQDRGAQLCSVVLGSTPLQLLDVSYNRISTVGIKAIMKCLSENDSLSSLSLNGMPMDQNASKAISYALAYNSSLISLNVCTCYVGYSGQRHIVAGIVSNRNVQLRKLTGFALGGITKTLGLPMVPEDWPNDRILSFVRYMWKHWKLNSADETARIPTRGPAPPGLVAASGKRAFAALSASQEAKLQFMQEHQALQEETPVIKVDSAILVLSNEGQNLQVPDWADHLDSKFEDDNESWSSDVESVDRSSYSGSSVDPERSSEKLEEERRTKNLQWLRAHFQSLADIGSLAFDNADLWQLHQYFFSPAYDGLDDHTHHHEATPPSSPPESSVPVSTEPSRTSRTDDSGDGSVIDDAVNPKKRGMLEDQLLGEEPSAKRPKNLKPRVAYFPRVREKLESLGTGPSTQTLALLRQLKYIESTLLDGKSTTTYNEDDKETATAEYPCATDVEMILLDLI